MKAGNKSYKQTRQLFRYEEKLDAKGERRARGGGGGGGKVASRNGSKRLFGRKPITENGQSGCARAHTHTHARKRTR